MTRIPEGFLHTRSQAAATVTNENASQTAKATKSTRLEVATFAVSHAFDHYGQMVEYVRMNGKTFELTPRVLDILESAARSVRLSMRGPARNMRG